MSREEAIDVNLAFAVLLMTKTIDVMALDSLETPGNWDESSELRIDSHFATFGTLVAHTSSSDAQ